MSSSSKILFNKEYYKFSQQFKTNTKEIRSPTDDMFQVASLLPMDQQFITVGEKKYMCKDFYTLAILNEKYSKIDKMPCNLDLVLANGELTQHMLPLSTATAYLECLRQQFNANSFTDKDGIIYFDK